MPLSSRLAVAAAVLLLSLSPVAQAAPLLADVRSTAIEAADAEVTGLLAGMQHEGQAGRLALSAASVDAVLEEEKSPGAAGQTGSLFGYDDLGPHNRSYSDVHDGRATLDPEHEIYVLPLPGVPSPQVSPHSSCGALAPSQVGEVRPNNRLVHPDIQERHNESADTSTALAWDETACRPDGWTVQGSFLLTLWNGDLAFEHADGSAAYTTGSETSDATTVAEFALVYNNTDRQLYLSVHDGRLEILGGGAEVYLADAHAEAGFLRLRAARGTVPALEDEAAAGSDLDLRGRLVADLAVRDGAVAARVAGRLDSAELGGRGVAVASASGLPPWAWVASLFLVPLLAGGGLLAWNRRPERALARLERLARSGRHAKVASASRRLQDVRDLAGEATALRVEALARTGRFPEAIAEARRLPPMEAGLANAFIHAMAGDADACASALLRCAELDAGWTRIALRNPVFAEARRHASLLGLVGAEGGPA